MYERTYNNRVLKQDENTKKRKKRLSWKRILFWIVILGFITGAFFMLRSPSLQVTSVLTTGTEVLDSVDIESNIKHQLEGKLLWFFPRTSTFLINKSSIENKLKESFSRIETVNVKRVDLHTLRIDIKEYRAMYLWCTGEVGEECYFMDKNGVVYNSAPVFSGTAYIKIITGAPVEAIPFQAMDGDDVTRVADFATGLSGINITPTTFRTSSPRKLEIDFLHNKDTNPSQNNGANKTRN